MSRSGLLACLSRDSSELKLYDVQQSTTESSGLLVAVTVMHPYSTTPETSAALAIQNHFDSHFPDLLGLADDL